MANILKYAEARQQPSTSVRVVKQQRLIKEMIQSDVNVAASVQKKILGNEWIRVDREQERLNRKRDLENLQHWTLEQKARLDKLKTDHFITALHRSVSASVAVDSYYSHEDSPSPPQSWMSPTTGVSPKKSSRFKTEASMYHPGKSAILSRLLTVRSTSISNSKAAAGLFDEIYKKQPVPHSACSTNINSPIPNKKRNKDYAMQLIMKEKSSLSHETFTKLIHITEKLLEPEEASSADKDYAMKVIMKEKLSLSNETLTKLIKCTTGVIKKHSTSIDLVGQTSALQQAGAAKRGSTAILDYALKMIITEKSILSDETLTKLIQCISDIHEMKQDVHLNQTDSISDYALKMILKEKLSLSDETLAKLIQVTTRNTTEVEHNIVDQEVSKENSITDYAIKVIMEEKMSLSDETLINLITPRPERESNNNEQPIASLAIGQYHGTLSPYKPISCSQLWHGHATLTGAGIEDKLQKEASNGNVLEKLAEDKSETDGATLSDLNLNIDKEQSCPSRSIVAKADFEDNLASISTTYSSSTSNDIMATEYKNRGNQVLSTEGSQFFADIECNFDEVASIVTNDVDRDLELKQDGPVFESSSKSKLSIRNLFSRKSSSLRQVTSANESPHQHRPPLIVRSLSQLFQRARSVVFKSRR